VLPGRRSEGVFCGGHSQLVAECPVLIGFRPMPGLVWVEGCLSELRPFWELVQDGITETNRTRFALFGMQNRAFGPYLITNPHFSSVEGCLGWIRASSLKSEAWCVVEGGEAECCLLTGRPTVWSWSLK
jgi:hypothetical protein